MHFLFIQKSLLSLIALSYCLVYAQLGPVVLSPAQNGTIPAGGKIDIVYQYQNIGTGNYSVDIQLWQDGAVSIPISDVAKNHEIKPGNSTGAKVNFYLNDTFTWNVPHGLNSTFWLTVTESAQTSFYKKGVSLRSRPVMLHTSAGSVVSSPVSIVVLLGISWIDGYR
ncbi:hypothetical protein CU098_007936 [Rhizopus stolonifer]|uniref:Translocon-associated protein subunit beta n=1 Tax=Rhizopus stolonifer TaxID=4846 RepID=A0A367JHU4_RHIST|nr:hypothetical protein CU098_007936 [Rhizopus stolonifer]